MAGAPEGSAKRKKRITSLLLLIYLSIYLSICLSIYVRYIYICTKKERESERRTIGKDGGPNTKVISLHPGPSPTIKITNKLSGSSSRSPFTIDGASFLTDDAKTGMAKGKLFKAPLILRYAVQRALELVSSVPEMAFMGS